MAAAGARAYSGVQAGEVVGTTRVSPVCSRSNASGPRMIRTGPLARQSPAEVWHALTDRATVAKSLDPNGIDARVAHRSTFQVRPNPDAKSGGAVHGEALVCDRSTQLLYTPITGGHGREVDSRVPYRLEPGGPGIRVLVRHSGIEMEPTRKGGEHTDGR